MSTKLFNSINSLVINNSSSYRDCSSNSYGCGINGTSMPITASVADTNVFINLQNIDSNNSSLSYNSSSFCLLRIYV